MLGNLTLLFFILKKVKGEHLRETKPKNLITTLRLGRGRDEVPRKSLWMVVDGYWHMAN